MADRHKTRPKAVRMPDGLLARVQSALADGESVNAFIVAAVEERLARLSGSTMPAPAAETVAPPPLPPEPRPAPASPFTPPEPAPKACRHPNFRGVKGVCPDCHQPVGYK